MLIKAPAKINWDLYLTGRLDNGYHLIDSVVQRVSLADEIVLEESGRTQLILSGPQAGKVPCDGSNLALRALEAFRALTGRRVNVTLRLTKNIPSGAGLGGGSADAAAVLTGLNRLLGTGLDQAALEKAGLALGADVPACLNEDVMLMRGIGEKLSPFPLRETYPIVIVKGNTGLSTAGMYAAYDRSPAAFSDRDVSLSREKLLQGDIRSFAEHAGNHFEAIAVSMAPQIGQQLKEMKNEGALYSAMTGSGAAVFGIFENTVSAERAARQLKKHWDFSICAHTLASSDAQPGV